MSNAIIYKMIYTKFMETFEPHGKNWAAAAGWKRKQNLKKSQAMLCQETIATVCVIDPNGVVKSLLGSTTRILFAHHVGLH